MYNRGGGGFYLHRRSALKDHTMKNKARMIEKKYGQEGFNYLFEIDKDSNLLWKNPTASCVKPGTVAGTIARESIIVT